MTTETSTTAHSGSPAPVNMSAKPPQVPTSKAPTPLTIRLLRDMDEEIWMSGSELKTDNSSSCCSDADESSDNRLDKLRKRKKRRTRSTKSYFDSQTKPDKLSVAPLRLDSAAVEHTSRQAAGQLATNDTDPEEEMVATPTWRPKRGSIASLPGLSTDLANIGKC